MDIISRKTAKEKGLTTYFTGKPCKHGHVDKRITASGYCMECNRQYKKTEFSKQEYRKYHNAHKDKVNARQRNWYGEVASSKLKELRKTDPDKAYKSARAWAKRNPWYGVSLNSARRKQIRKATPKWADKKAIVELYKLSHLMSNDNERYHIDHIIPLINDNVCGLHCEDNLRIIPAYDNMSKGNKLTL